MDNSIMTKPIPQAIMPSNKKSIVQFYFLISMQSIIVFILLFCWMAVAESNASDRKKAGDYFKHLMEQAHPSLNTAPFINEKILVPRKQSGFSFFDNKNLINTELDPLQPQNESSIAVNPLNPNNLIASAVDYREGSATWVYISDDKGKTWRNINLGKPFSNWRSTNDPSVAYDAGGRGYLVYGGFGTLSPGDLLVGENGVFLSRTEDGGKTWDKHNIVIVHQGEQTLDSTFEDKYYISIDNSKNSPYFNHLYIPWKRVTPRDSATQIVLSKSTDYGETWSTPVNVSHRLSGSSEDTTFGQSFPLAACGPDGSVYVVWNHGIAHGVGFNRSLDGGKTFGTPRIIHNYNIFGETRDISGNGTGVYRHTVKGGVRAEAYPVIVCDTLGGSRNGWIYVCWAADNPPNIYFSRSTDNGDNWSEPKIVHATDKNDQFWAWMSIDPKSGNLAIMYFDSRNFENNDLVQCYVSYSSDGGDNWIDRQIGDVGSDLKLNPFGGRAFAGDYSGLAFYDGFIYPSWVDMRNSIDNSSDNDVYTAVVNTQAPLPLIDFKANTIADMPDRIRLDWKLPDKPELAFGQSVSEDELKINLFRDNQFIERLDWGSINYIDDGLEPFDEYSYRGVVVRNDDTSAERLSNAFAGGSKQPDKPTIIAKEGMDDNSVKLSILTPNLRKDRVTPFSNFAGLNLYRDGEFVGKFDFNPSDTGKIVEIIDQAPERGYYDYHATAIDANTPANESDTSSHVLLYTGVVENSFAEIFTDAKIKKYYINEGWAINTNHFSSTPYSIHESNSGDYENRKEYIFAIFPVYADFTPENPIKFQLQFSHAADIDNQDPAIVEYSYDFENWTELKRFTSDSYPTWSDGTIDANDWQIEKMPLVNIGASEVYFRFRLSTNAFRTNDGWYIDDIIVTGVITSVENEAKSSEVFAFPNPAQNFITIVGANANTSIRLFDNMGYIHRIDNPFRSDNKLIIDLSNFSSGVYFIELLDMNRIKRMIPIVKY